jgi:phosphate transport system substrate-binding protein
VLSHSEGAVGYVGYEFAHRYGLQIALLENKSGNFVAPNEESLRAALASAELPENLRAFVPDPSRPEAYPIATFTWVLLRRKYTEAPKAQALRDLFTWALGQGQSYASALGYIPLPSEVGAKALAELQSIKP